MTPSEPPPMPGAQICANCGRQLAEHHPANYADGPLIGRRLEVCPIAIFAPLPDEKMPEFLS